MYRGSKLAVASHAITMISRFHWLCTHAVCDPNLHSSSVTIKGSAMLCRSCYSSLRQCSLFVCYGGVVLLGRLVIPHPTPLAAPAPLWPQEFSNANIYHKSRAAGRAAFLLPASLGLFSDCCKYNFDDYSEVFMVSKIRKVSRPMSWAGGVLRNCCTMSCIKYMI